MLIQDRCRRQVQDKRLSVDRGCRQASRQAAVVGQVAQDRGRPTDSLSCAKTGAAVKKKLAETQAHNTTTCIFGLISPT